MKLLDCTHVLPSKKITNDQLISEIVSRNRKAFSSRDLDTIKKKINALLEGAGTRARYHRDDAETAAELTAAAGEKLLKKINLHPGDVDMLIYAGVGRGCLEPANANIFQSLLRLKNATCFDVLDACASWLRSLAIARSFIKQGECKVVMVLNSEFNFREYADFEIKSIADIDHTYSAFTIGEAATAAVLTEGNCNEDFYFSFKNWGELHNLCMIPLPNVHQYVPSSRTNSGKPLRFFAQSDKLVSLTMKKLIDHFYGNERLRRDKYDIVFGHAASEASSTYWIRRAGLDEKLLFRTHAKYGNTVSASIPLAISLASEQGRLKRGMRGLIVIGSAGVVTAYSNFVY